MRLVIQRVSEASVEINSKTEASIGSGMLVLIGIVDEDKEDDISWLVRKILNMRIFDDDEGVMNLSLLDTEGEILLISQFTLHASTKKGNRPSYIKAARPETAIPLYDRFTSALKGEIGDRMKTGVFGAHMKVSLINDGPVTIIIDSKLRE